MAARRIHLDIETYRTRNPATVARITREATERRPNGNTAKAIKEVWDTPEAVAERVREALDKTATNPLHCEILCISASGGGTEPVIFSGMGTGVGLIAPGLDVSESDALCLFCEWCEEVAGPETIWSAFNGKRFDFPVILNRMIRHGITPPAHFPVYSGGWRGRIFDTMERLPTYDPFTSFVEACEAYGLECKTVMWRDEPMNGGRVAEAFEAGEFQVIRNYCASDVIHEEALYLAMTHGDTWGTFDAGHDAYAVLAEIAESELSPAQKWLSASPILKSAGILP